DEVILVPIRQNVGDLESISTLNDVAARIWELIDGKMKVREIKDKIIEEFDVTPQEAEKDLVEYIKQLEKIEAVK
ncbi:MAG: PqqD family protein, partial [Candidatus Aminicenantes bacterium]